MHFRRIFFSVAMTVALLKSTSVVAVNFQLPPRPVSPTNHEQCAALARAAQAFFNQYRAEVEAITRTADQTLQSGSQEWQSEYARSFKLSEDGWNHYMTIIAMRDQCNLEVNAYESRLAESQRRQEESRRQAEAYQVQQQQAAQTRAEQGRQALETYRQAQQARSAANAARSAPQRPAATIAGAVFGFLSDLARNSARSSPPINTEDERDYSNEHDLLTDMGRSGTPNPVAREVLDASSNELKRRNLEMIERMHKLENDMRSFQAENRGTNTNSNFTPQSLNAALEAELSRAALSATPTSAQQRMDDAISEQLRQSGSPQMAAYNGAETTAESSTPAEDVANYWVPDKEIISLADGSRFQGTLINGEPFANGILVNSNGVRYEGYFEKGKLKYGVITYTNGVRVKVEDGNLAGRVDW